MSEEDEPKVAELETEYISPELDFDFDAAEEEATRAFYAAEEEATRAFYAAEEEATREFYATKGLKRNADTKLATKKRQKRTKKLKARTKRSVRS